MIILVQHFFIRALMKGPQTPGSTANELNGVQEPEKSMVSDIVFF